MNLLDIVDYTQILSETSIFSRGSYSYGHKVKLSTSTKGEKLLQAIQQEFPDFNPTQEIEWVDPATVDGECPEIQYGKKSTNVRYFLALDDNQYFAINGTDGMIETSLVHASRFNKGDIAEASLGAALMAKLLLRGGKKVGDIDIKDVKDILEQSITSKGSLTIKSPDANNLVSDKFTFRLRLPTGSQEAIEKKENWPKFEDLFRAAVHYANSPDAERYSNYFYLNGKVDEVYIESDGVGNQKGTKTDVKAVVVTKDPDTGKEITRTLKNVDISLKADSVKYGQHSSGGLTKTAEVWLDSAKRLFEPLGITVEMPARGKTDILKFWTAIYKQAAEKLNKELANASFAKETTFVEKIADLIALHGSGGSKTLRLISFEKGQSSIHSFNIVKQKLKERNIDLRVRCSIGPRSGKPTLHIYDAHNPTGEGLLTNIRFYLTEKASTNYFEKGPLLHELTKVEKSPFEVKKQQAAPAVVAPARSTLTPQPQPAKQQSIPQIDHPGNHIAMDEPENAETSI